MVDFEIGAFAAHWPMLTSRRYPIGYSERNQFPDRSLAAPPGNHSFPLADLSGIFLSCSPPFFLNVSLSENLFSWNCLLNRRWQENGDGYSADAFLSSFFFSHFKSPRRSKLIGRPSLQPLTIPIGAFWELSTCFWPKGMFGIVRLREYAFPFLSRKCWYCTASWKRLLTPGPLGL